MILIFCDLNKFMQPAIRHSFVSFPLTLTLLTKFLFNLYIPLQTYTYKLNTYRWNALPLARNCLFLQFIDAQAGILWTLNITCMSSCHNGRVVT